MKKIIYMMTFVIFLLSNVVQVTAADETDTIINNRLISNREYKIIDNKIWFAETSCTTYDKDNIKWWSEGTKIYMQADISENPNLMEEYSTATDYVLRVKEDSESDWKYEKIHSFNNGLMEASLDVSSYDDGQYFMGIYIDHQCLSESVNFYIRDNKIYFGAAWDGIWISSYNEYELLEGAISNKDPAQVLEEYKNSTMMVSYGAYEGGDAQVQALELTKDETSEMMKARRIYEWLMRNRCDYEDYDLFCNATAMFSSINIPCQLCLLKNEYGYYLDYLIYIYINQQWIPIDFCGDSVERFMPSMERMMGLSNCYEDYKFYEYTPISDTPVDKDGLAELHIRGNFRYDVVEDVLRYVNDERRKAGVSELTLDMELTTGAMQRAIESTVVFEHIRPNGKSFVSINPKARRENLAINSSSSAQGVVAQWMNSQGHKDNLLANNNKSIGVGCVEHNGKYYWVQLFGEKESTTSFRNKGNVNKKGLVNVKYSILKKCYQNGSTTQIPKQMSLNDSCDGRLVLTNYTAEGCKVILESTCLTYQFPNDQFDLNEKTGKFTAIGAGTSYIIIEIGEERYLKNVLVEGGDKDEPSSNVYLKNQVGCYSAIYTYGSKMLDLVNEAQTISTTQPAFTLTCKVRNKSIVTKYALYSGTKKIYENSTGVFNVEPAKLSVGNQVSVRTYSENSYVKTSLLLDVIAGKESSIAVNLGGDKLELDLPQSVPLIGGDKVAFSLPDLPVEAVLEDGKLKVGFNIKKRELYSSNSNEGNTTTTKTQKKDINKRIQDWKKELQKTGYINNDFKGYLKSNSLKADMPGVSKSVDFVVFGYAEGTWSDSLETMKGELIIAITGSGTYQHQFVSVPITVNVKGAVNAQLNGSVIWNVVASDLNGELSTHLNISIEPYVGAGVGTYLSFGLYGNSQLILDVNLIGKKNIGLENLYLTGEIGLKGYFAKKEVYRNVLLSMNKIKTGKLAKYMDDDKLLLYSQTKSSVVGGVKKTEINETNNELLTIQQAPYEEADYQEPTLKTFSDVTNSYTLLEQAYGGADPHLATVGGQTVIVFVNQDGNRGEADQTAISYIVYDKTQEKYSEPKIIEDDGTADSNPELITINGVLYAYYLDARKTFGDENPEIEEYAEAFGITVARYDSTSKTFTKLGTTQGGQNYCYSPVLVQHDEDILLSWVENASNNIFGQTKDNSICYSVFYDGKWGDVVTLDDNLPAVADLAVLVDTEPEFAYTLNLSSDVLSEKIELHMNKAGNDKIIENGVISGLKYETLPNVPQRSLICNVDGMLTYYDVDKNEFVNLSEELLGIGSDYQIVGTDVFFVKSDMEDGTATRNAYKLCWDGEKYNVVKITKEASDVYVDKFSTDGMRAVYLSTEVENIGEDENDMVLSYQVKMLDDMKYHTISVDYVNVDYTSLGLKYDADITIKNHGTEKVSNLVISLLDQDENVVIEKVLEADLSAGETKIYSTSFEIPENLSEDGYVLVVHEQGQDNEVRYSETIDLAKTELSIDASYVVKEKEKYIEVTICNESNVGADADVVVKDEKGNIIYSGIIYVPKNDLEKIQIGIEDEMMPIDGTDTVFTAAVSTDQTEYYDINNEIGLRVWNINASEQVVVVNDENGDSDKNKDDGNTGDNSNLDRDKTKIQVKRLKLNGISKKIAAGKRVALKPMFVPTNVTNKKLKWRSSNKKYATVDRKGVVTTKRKGAGKSVIITAVAQDGSKIKATYKISIMKHAVRSIKLVAKNKTVKAGKKIKLKAIVKTTGKNVNKELDWKSSNTRYATVSKKGVVTAKKAGKGKVVRISVKSKDGTNKKATIKIKIK